MMIKRFIRFAADINPIQVEQIVDIAKNSPDTNPIKLLWKPWRGKLACFDPENGSRLV